VEASSSHSKLGQEEVAHRQKPSLSSVVYHCRNPQSTTFWRVKQGMDKLEVGLSQKTDGGEETNV
jgi:hypothetical protein